MSPQWVAKLQDAVERQKRSEDAGSLAEETRYEADEPYHDWGAQRPVLPKGKPPADPASHGKVDAMPLQAPAIPQLCPKVHAFSDLASQCAVEERVEALTKVKQETPDTDMLWRVLTDASFQLLTKLQAVKEQASGDAELEAEEANNPKIPTYGSYRAAALRVVGGKGQGKATVSSYLGNDYVSPHLFFLAPRASDTSSATPTVPIYTHITRKTVLQEMRIMLELCDSSGDGYLTESDFELFINKIMPNLRTVKHVQQMMQGHYSVFYKCHAARKFFFFLDPSHRGRLSIETILNSETLFELAKLFQIGVDEDDADDEEMNVPEDLQTNWFTFQIMYRVYQHYVELDTEGDGNGMLSLDEMLGYNAYSFSPLFIQRIFEKYPTSGYASEIDYKRYLDFVLATEHTSTPQSLQYFWNALDIGECGVLARPHVDLYAKELSQKFQQAGLPVIEPDDITREIFDMVNPKHPEKITMEDIRNCGQMDTVLSILVDYKAFHNYDCRESIYASNAKGQG